MVAFKTVQTLWSNTDPQILVRHIWKSNGNVDTLEQYFAGHPQKDVAKWQKKRERKQHAFIVLFIKGHYDVIDAKRFSAQSEHYDIFVY